MTDLRILIDSIQDIEKLQVIKELVENRINYLENDWLECPKCKTKYLKDSFKTTSYTGATPKKVIKQNSDNGIPSIELIFPTIHSMTCPKGHKIKCEVY